MARIELLAAQREVVTVLLLSLLILFFLLDAQFQSLLLPLLLLSAVLLSIPGTLAAPHVFAQPISLSVALGALMLVGLVINTSIVLFATYAKAPSTAGLTRRWAAVMSGSRRRVRAVLTTALSTVVALLGADHTGLAAVVIGGVLTTTLFVLPIGYACLIQLQRR